MPAPLDPDKRAAILDDILEGKTRNAIARDHDVAQSTVSRIAAQEGITDAWDRADSKRATELRMVDVKARQSELAQLLAEDVHRLRRMLWEPCTVYKFGGKDNTLATHDLEEPDFEGKRNLMTTIGIAVDKIAVLTRDDAQGLAAVDSWLRSLGVGATT
ncbi:hypothetical protein [Blastococcus sp. CT_GayMR16]|uniref:hypothetical protein n=1 Tax=Blastococcus sp. CT_GayMR16 TaxID=2559607 RepID=UPI0010735962|nr:hypothetical protein [Blastococcus sp. CT_GayMR16]TFV91391.1 hypothetical protein E4P38_02045 [Blastococcus sp. CT_GayMR16]